MTANQTRRSAAIRMPLSSTLLAPFRAMPLVVLLLSSCTSGDQQARESVTLAPGSAGVSVGVEPHVLDLENGRVAITAMGLHAVVLHDFATGRADTVGRDGAGPGEFALPTSMVPWDTARFAVVDPMLRRVAILRHDGTLDTLLSFPLGNASNDADPSKDGSWLSRGVAARNDSMPLVRSFLSNAHVDTRAWVAFPPRHLVPVGNMALNMPLEYAAADDWGRLQDGRIWIARAADNRVDWMLSDGTVVRGEPRPFARIPTVDADRRKHKGMPASPTIDTVERDMAPLKAPFQEVRAGPNGELWFWLNQPAGYTTERYTVLAPDGKTSVDAIIPGGHKVLGVGTEYMYLLGEDAEGDMVVTRHPKPREVRVMPAAALKQ